ncbi:hypothetical protein GLYMA_06G276700v4 [Glycine max]|uniref:Uncharacterized protein n=1 Tax=Glycine max TaxID=3847 RepID=I1KEM7_SOYBN|nr:hypothetical protein JHK86_016717 [Glycine max]KAH1127901.1 hypothetical protein GYH30_016456 [Glycine max]KRH55735.1 hypothetical protein GLYMA_06G276700v4 [Glycine max]
MARHFLDAHANEAGLVLHSSPMFLFLMIVASLSIISMIIFACGDDNKRTNKGGGGGGGGCGGGGCGGGCGG